MTAREAMSTYGIYTGQAINFFNLPQTLITALAVSVLPTIASARAAGNHAKSPKHWYHAAHDDYHHPAGRAGFIMLAVTIVGSIFSLGLAGLAWWSSPSSKACCTSPNRRRNSSKSTSQ